MTRPANNQWDIKDKKEKPYMLFGSLCHYFSRVHAQTKKEMTADEIRDLFRLCCQLTEEHINAVSQSENQITSEEDLPL